jgi:putative ABC transport system permease protein
MLIALYTSLNERRREMAILRALGAGPIKILFLLVLESSLLTFFGILLGVAMTYGLTIIAQPIVEREFGLIILLEPPSQVELIYLGVILLGGVLIGLVPAWRAFKNALSDGLVIRN